MSERSPAQQNEALHYQTGSSASFGSGQGRWVTYRLLGQADLYAPDPVCTMPRACVISSVHTAQGDGVRALPGASHASAPCEFVDQVYLSWGRGGG